MRILLSFLVLGFFLILSFSCNTTVKTKEECFASGIGFCAFCQLNESLIINNSSFCFEIDVCDYDFFTQCHNSILEGELFYKADFSQKILKEKIRKCEASHKKDDIAMIIIIIIAFCAIFCLIFAYIRKADINLQRQTYTQFDG